MVLIIVVSFLPGKADILLLFGLLILFHAVFIFYINLRRVQMDEEAGTIKAKLQDEKQQAKHGSFFIKVMDYFFIPRKESGYFKWFLLIGFCGRPA